MPPHSGCGLGFDRFIMVLSGLSNIREVSYILEIHHELVHN